MLRRRDFLKLAGLCGVSVAVPFGGGARAQSAGGVLYDGTFFVLVNAGGGWDPTSLCDPKGMQSESEQDPMNRSYFTGDIQTSNGIAYAPVGYNPTFFQKYGSRLLVVNGIDTATNGHDSGSRFTWSGKLAEGNPSFGALVAAAKSRSSPMAFLSYGGYDFTGGLVAPTRSGDTGVLQRIAYPDRIDPDDENARFHTTATEDRIKAAMQQRLEAQQQRTRLPRVKNAMATLYAARLGEGEVKRLADYLPSELDNSGNPLRRQAQLALASYKAGLSVSVNLDVGGFDTHGDHDAQHIPALAQLLEGVDFLLEEAERMDVADKVVVVIGSDFGRTPGYNDGDGKDHWSITSMMFMGPGIQGGRVIGATTERHHPRTVDPSTLALSDSGIRITPEHVHRALRKLAGIEEADVAKRHPVGGADLALFT